MLTADERRARVFVGWSCRAPLFALRPIYRRISLPEVPHDDR